MQIAVRSYPGVQPQIRTYEATGWKVDDRNVLYIDDKDGEHVATFLQWSGVWQVEAETQVPMA